jgi:hypothetical protein
LRVLPGGEAVLQATEVPLADSVAKLVVEVSIVVTTQPAELELLPRKIKCAALPAVACDGQVREAVTKASVPEAVEFVSTEGLKRWSALAQAVVVGVKVNSGDVPLVENLYSRQREKPPTLIA